MRSTSHTCSVGPAPLVASLPPCPWSQAPRAVQGSRRPWGSGWPLSPAGPRRPHGSHGATLAGPARLPRSSLLSCLAPSVTSPRVTLGGQEVTQSSIAKCCQVSLTGSKWSAPGLSAAPRPQHLPLDHSILTRLPRVCSAHKAVLLKDGFHVLTSLLRNFMSPNCPQHKGFNSSARHCAITIGSQLCLLQPRFPAHVLPATCWL